MVVAEFSALTQRRYNKKADGKPSAFLFSPRYVKSFRFGGLVLNSFRHER